MWLIFRIVTVALWIGSTIHVIVWRIDNNLCKKPYLLKITDSEARISKYSKMWAYAPTVLLALAWGTFKDTPTGISIITWLKQKV